MSVSDLKYRISAHEFPPLPKKTMACVFALFAVGIGLFILGFIEEVNDVDPTKGIMFWVLGVLVFSPGVFYTIQL
jgi:hypothetical protein